MPPYSAQPCESLPGNVMLSVFSGPLIVSFSERFSALTSYTCSHKSSPLTTMTQTLPLRRDVCLSVCLSISLYLCLSVCLSTKTQTHISEEILPYGWNSSLSQIGRTLHTNSVRTIFCKKTGCIRDSRKFFFLHRIIGIV